MEISLNPDIEQIISRQIRSGKYSTPADVIRRAVLLLDAKERQSLSAETRAKPDLANPRRSPRGILADIRSNIDPAEIKEARKELWGDFPREEH